MTTLLKRCYGQFASTDEGLCWCMWLAQLWVQFFSPRKVQTTIFASISSKYPPTSVHKIYANYFHVQAVF